MKKEPGVMIEVNKKFTIERDTWCWIVHHKKKKIDTKTKRIKTSIKSTYHGSIPQACEKILNEMSGECETVQKLADLFTKGVNKLSESIKVKV